MFTEDLTTFFADFGTPGVLNGAAVVGVFDAGFALGDVGIGMAGTQPTYTLASAGVVGDPVGQQLVVSGVTYYVAAHQPDGTGMSRLLLEVMA